MSSIDKSDKPEWRQDAIALAEGGLSWRAISKELNIPRTTVSDFLRKHFSSGFEKHNKTTETYAVRKMDDGEDNSRILLISDMHIPYHHQDTLAFLQHLKDKYNPTRVICLGDEVDSQALSYHEHDPDLPSAGDELRKALPIIKHLHKMFPKMDIIESNHGSLIWRKAKTNGIPRHYIKNYNEILEVGDGWKWSYDLTIKLPNGTYCYIHHGKSNDVIKTSQLSGMSAVQGHYHEKFKIDYWGNANGLFFGLQCGCLIDDDQYAFSYNNCNLKRPVIGTGLIIDSQPILEPMILGENGRWKK